MYFAHPQFLWLLILIPIYIGLCLLWKKQSGYNVSVFADLLKARRYTLQNLVPILRHLLLVSIIAIFAVTLAYPQKTHTTQDISKKGIDVVIALDVSDSMRAEDLKPNRMEAAKQALREFIDTRENDRVGIVIFAGMPFTQSPLTFDYKILDHFIKNISTDSINQGTYGAGGTAVGDAVLAGLNRLKDDSEREKIIVLISDGDANVGVDPIIAAQKAKEENVKIYTIGIGKEGGAPIPVTDQFGRKQYAQNRDGTTYMATFDETSLQKITDLTGGKFFRVGDTKRFEEALADIDALQKRDISVSNTIDYSDAFLPWLYALGVLLFIFLCLETLSFTQK